MNYIEKINCFWRSHEEHSFTTTEVALYFYLLKVCNICHWKNPFKRNNSKIEADLGICYGTLKNARNKLQQLGLISFKTLSGSPNVVYTLLNFREVNVEVDNENTVEVDNEDTVEVDSLKDKLNETKLNNERETPARELFFTIENLFKEFSEHSWLEQVGMNYQISPEKIKKFFKEFCDELLLKGGLKSKEDFKSHFINWLKIQITKNNVNKPQRPKGKFSENGSYTSTL